MFKFIRVYYRGLDCTYATCVCGVVQVYFTSRYRGICVGTLVSRAAVLTAAVCVTSPAGSRHDTRPVTVVTGSTYRHPRRGIRVQVTRILIPRR